MNEKCDSLDPMRTAPRDGSVIVVRARGFGLVPVRYVDCEWLRQPCPLTGKPGDPNIKDCWRISEGKIKGTDVELEAATGWCRGDLTI